MSARILVVEDDRFIREVVALALRAEGYQVDAVGDGAIAWQRLSTARPEMAILDIALPRIDGLTLCRQIRASETDGRLPVLVVSAMTTPSTIRAALSAGADSFLDKPFNLAELVERVRTLLHDGSTTPPDSAAQAPASQRSDCSSAT